MKALIVDDERRTRETLRDAIPWGESGIDELRLARNGAEALEIALQWRPDIVVTDVRMPKMDGIELAKALRGAALPCRILFLSAYTDVDYLKDAIRVRAEDYLEKPVEPRAVAAAVSAAVASLAAERRAATPRGRALESLLMDLGAGAPTREELEERYRSAVGAPSDDGADGPPSLPPLLRPLALRAAWTSETSETERASALHELAAAVNGGHLRLRRVLAASAVGASTLLAIASDSGDRAEAAGRALVRAAEEERPFDLRATVGIGPAVEEPARFPAAFALAEAALARAFYEDDAVVVLESEPPSGELRPAPTSELASAFAAGRVEEALTALRRAAEEDRAVGSTDLSALRRKWVALLKVVADRAGGLSASEAERETADSTRRIEAAPSFKELVSYVEQRTVALHRPNAGSAGREKAAAEVKSVVRGRYMDGDLSVESVAREVGLSVAYLCTLFKRTTGMTVKDYIDSVRIEAAKAALRSSDDKLAVVAERVGFRDPNHFSAFFKTHTGLTPREYRTRSEP